MTVNDFIFECQLGSVNLLQLLYWVRETKLLHKVSGFAHTQEVCQDAPPLGNSRFIKDGSVTGSGGGSSLRVTRLSVLQACVTFIATLTNPDNDGRIIIEGGCSPSCVPVPGPLDRQTAVFPHTPQATGKQPGTEPCVKFILLNAAACFSKVLSEARSVILASGTLSPIRVCSKRLQSLLIKRV